MVDVVSIVAIIVSGIIGLTGPILKPLWEKLKNLYRRSRGSRRYLQGLGQARLTTDIQQLLVADPGLAASAQRFYIDQEQPAEDATYSSDFSDFSDF
ncbi:hypothetical protein F5Y10DRAFT_273087 [Nemania abortiva]|nr:hypothetical protein F5Y10DRAFT_273087 [Nemania abortiva]